ncbi:hypothetical protein F8388_001242 [Cannabis sativa]|uniref:Uncharacterized protein n=1 Tax=Cannabis sativa TaxID=3483 RepID=A0A7J6GGY6_CANSA|nr:hypothetical protein F8388_001242 [Cannabis sativa]
MESGNLQELQKISDLWKGPPRGYIYVFPSPSEKPKPPPMEPLRPSLVYSGRPSGPIFGASELAAPTPPPVTLT